MSNSWPTLLEQTLLIDGYCRQKYINTIPFALVRAILLFYNEIFYWKVKGEQLKQFLSRNHGNNSLNSTCITVNDIQIQYELFHAERRSDSHFGIAMCVINIRNNNNIKYVVIHNQFYIREVDICRYFTGKYDLNSTGTGITCVKYEDCAQFTEITFCCKLNLLRIQPINMNNNKPLLFSNKQIEMKKSVKVNINFSDKLLEKLVNENRNNASKYNHFHSQLTNDKNWVIRIYKKNNVYRITFSLLKLSHLIKKFNIYWSIKLKHNEKYIVNKQSNRIINFDNMSRCVGSRHIFNEIKKTDVLSVDVKIDLIKIFDFNDNEIAQNKWCEYGVV